MLAVVIGGCTAERVERAPIVALDSLPSPAGPGSGEPNLAVDDDGLVYLSWLERTADSSHVLRVASLEGTRWGATHDIARGHDFFANWADFPSVAALGGGRLAVHWLQLEGAGKYAYGVRIAQSSDGGATWSAPVIPHRDSLQAEHGFASLFAAEGDSLGAVWLDGRKSEMPDSAREMMLASTTIAADGGLGAERFLDRRICDCCQTAMARTGEGWVVVYRDRSASEVRDIYAVRLTAAGWSEPTSVHDDRWTINACPVNGPAIASRGDTLAVAWFTGAGDTARVHVAFSHDAGATFGAPARVDDGNPAGRVDVELDDRGRALVSWVERTGGEGAEVRLRAVRNDGAVSPASIITASSAARASGFPRMVRAGDHLVIAWTEPGSIGRVRVARARLGDGQ